MLPLFYLPFDLAMSRVLYFAGKRILYLIIELSYVLNENSKNYQSSLFGKKYMYVSVPFRRMYGSSSFLSIFCHFFARIVDFLRKKLGLCIFIKEKSISISDRLSPYPISFFVCNHTIVSILSPSFLHHFVKKFCCKRTLISLVKSTKLPL